MSISLPDGVKPVHVDGTLYVFIAVCSALVTAFSTDDAAKYVSPEILFWLKTLCEASGAGGLALKMYRSTGYADSKPRGDTQTFVKP